MVLIVESEEDIEVHKDAQKLVMDQIKKQDFYYQIINLNMLFTIWKNLNALWWITKNIVPKLLANVGAVLRKQMLRRAKELSINITNQKSKKVEELEKKLKKDESAQ